MTEDLGIAEFAVLDYLYDHYRANRLVINWDTTPAAGQPDEHRTHNVLLYGGFIQAEGRVRASGTANLVKLAPTAVDLMQNVRQLRGSRSMRARLCRDRVLTWYDGLSRFKTTDPVKFLDHDLAVFAGVKFTVDEVRAAAAWLASRGLLHEQRSLAGATYWLDDEGQAVMDEGGLLAYLEAQRPAPTTRIEVRDSNGIQVNTGHNVRQHIGKADMAVTEGFADIDKVAAEVLRRLPELKLSDDDREVVEDSAREIAQEVRQDEPRRGLIRRGFAAIKGVLITMRTGALEDAGGAVAGELLDKISDIQL